ncbi:MAG: copper homeostasis protein CutC [Terriglobales bacterium]
MRDSELIVEVCVDSPESALAAQQGGARRVELCSGLMEGGVTPSAGLIATVRHNITIGLHVMIRPRGGDFCYSAAEFSVMQRDVLMAKQLGADGVVFGILDLDGQVDIQRTRQLVELARPLKTTFHRAFDMSVDIPRSLEAVIQAGAHRILTSGGSPTALDGALTLRQLVETAAGRIIVMGCGGIDAQNVRTVLENSGVREIHVGLRTRVDSPMRYRNQGISMRTTQGNEYQRFVVLKESVAGLLHAASAK